MYNGYEIYISKQRVNHSQLTHLGGKIMKKMSLMIAGIALVVFSGCTSITPRGVITTNIVVPLTATNGQIGKKVGKASCVSWFGMVASGDASIRAAAKNGNIKKITHVDWKVKSDIPIGIKTIYTTTVYGE